MGWRKFSPMMLHPHPALAGHAGSNPLDADFLPRAVGSIGWFAFDPPGMVTHSLRSHSRAGWYTELVGSKLEFALHPTHVALHPAHIALHPALLRPADEDALAVLEVGDAVNDVREDGPHLLDPPLKLF